MPRLLTIVAVLGTLAAATALRAGSPAADPAPPASVEVMVLGTWHFANPGLDINNVRAEDVRTPERQAELEALAWALAQFRPTKIMVERVATGPSLTDERYARFTPASLASDPDERVQIAYRLARKLGHDRVFAIDEQPAEGEPDYFPFGAVTTYAAANGMGERLEAVMEAPAAETRHFDAIQASNTIAQLLAHMNDPSGFFSSIGSYYGLLSIGDTTAQPGADLNAMWYLRNAKIFAKLMTVAQPGDRVLVVYGSGHNYWLRHFAAETPGFKSVDPIPYLKNAVGK